MASKKKQSGKRKGGMRKRGRSIQWCQAYRLRGQREKNKKAKLIRHCSRHPLDLVAAKAKEKLR